MSDENEEVDKAKGDEQDDFAHVPILSDDILDAEFSETRSPMPLNLQQETDDDEPAIAAEVVDDAPAAKVVDDNLPTPDSPLDRFFADLPDGETGSVTIAVKRRADPKNASFRIPCKIDMHVGNYRWSGESPAEFHDQIRDTDGGGLYQCQLRYGKGFSDRTWTVLIADPAGPSERERNLQASAKTTEHERIPETSHAAPQQPLDPFAEMKKRLQEANEIKELLGVKEPEPSTAVAEAIPVKDQIALEMMKFAGNSDPELGSQVIKKILGISDSKDEKSWSDIAWYGVTHANEIAQVVNVVGSFAVPMLGSLFGRKVPPPNMAIQPANIRPIGAVNMPPQPPANQPTVGVVMPPAGPQTAQTANDAAEAEKTPPAASKPIPRVKW